VLLISVYYAKYQNNDLPINIEHEQVVDDLMVVLSSELSNITNDHETSFSESQLTPEIVEILNADIKEIEERLSQVDSDDYSSDDRFADMNVLAMKYQSLADWDKVGSIYLDILDNFQERPLAWYNLATYQIKAGSWRSASDNLFRSLELNNQFIPVWSQLLELYQYQIKIGADEMTGLYNLAIAYTNDNSILRLYAEYLESNGQLEAALSKWKLVYEQTTENKQVILDRINRVQKKINSQ